MSELSVGSLSGLAANSYVIDVASGSQLTQPGMILQVVSTTKTDAFSTSSTSPVAITGLTASITPSSASSKILVMTSVHVVIDGSSYDGAPLILTRGGTDIAVATSAGSRTEATMGSGLGTLNREMHNYSMTHLDSPATTSSTTYGVNTYSMTGGGSAFVNRSLLDIDSGSYLRTVSSITVMEVAV